LPGAVFLDNFHGRSLNSLVRRVAVTAIGADSPPTRCKPVVARTRIDDAVVIFVAGRAFHEVSRCGPGIAAALGSKAKVIVPSLDLERRSAFSKTMSFEYTPTASAFLF